MPPGACSTSLDDIHSTVVRLTFKEKENLLFKNVIKKSIALSIDSRPIYYIVQHYIPVFIVILCIIRMNRPTQRYRGVGASPNLENKKTDPGGGQTEWKTFTRYLYYLPND